MRVWRAAAFTLVALVVTACGQPAAPTASPASNVPCGPSEVFTRHDHAHLTILIRGQIKTVPAFVGITATSICWLHTHDTSGIIHIEAGDNRTLTLGDFFAVWRQPLSQTVIDGEPRVRLMIPLSLSYDHRVINGADAARFIVKLASLLSDPFQLMSEV